MSRSKATAGARPRVPPIALSAVTALTIVGALAALVPALFMWGFTVDDALIPLRYAHHLGHGSGYRFNANGPSTDGVTPLPWAPLLVPLTSSALDLMSALVRVKVVGIAAWTIAGAFLGRFLGHMTTTLFGKQIKKGILLSLLSLFVIALAFPIGAWSASGLETGFAIALVTIAAVSFHAPRRAALLAGLVATLRPELVVWSLVFAFGSAISRSVSDHETTATTTATTTTIARHAAVPIALAFTPFAVCALIRLALFGRAAPLATLAKPSDFTHGWIYAGAAVVVVLTPMLAFAPIVLVRRAGGGGDGGGGSGGSGASPHAKTLVLAAGAHVLVMIAVGGDWMPYARLMVPIAPSLAIVFVDVGRFAHVASTGVRAIGAVVLGILVALKAAPAGRQVLDTRSALIISARPLLADARVVASVDVGWVGAATDAEIVDLAGLTDASIAVLRGGHTSKAVDTAMLLDRHVEKILIYNTQRRVVEDRLMHTALFQRSYELESTITANGLSYGLYRRVVAAPPVAAPPTETPSETPKETPE